MTSIKLLELLVKLEHNKITKEEIIGLKEFTDEEVDLILNVKHKREITKLIKNKDFRIQPIEIQKQIIEIIDTYESTNNSLYYATEIAIEKNAINSGHIIELVKMAIQLKDEDKLLIVYTIACNHIAVLNKDILKIIKMIIESEKTKDIVSLAKMTVMNKYMFRTGRVTEIVKSILNADNEQEAMTLFNEEFKKAITINLLDALNNGTVNEISLWDLLDENTNIALKLIALAMYPKEDVEQVMKQTQFMTELEYKELSSKYKIESQENECDDAPLDLCHKKELSPYLKVRKK